ncbi:MAG: sigma-70 family RNA polymerase sigma factor [Ruminococcus sp.]|nr:sigma-70 family RNA polymerase sigma factor [Ruminococcus sp.]
MTSNKKNQLFTEIYNENCDSILRLCYMYLKDKELAQDATQETFLKAYKSLNSFREHSKINTWLSSIAINTCKNIIRSSKYKRTDLTLEEVEYQLRDTVCDSDEIMSVSEAVASLPRQYKEVIILRYYRDLPLKDISKILSIPQTTVNYRLLKAKALLKDTLKEDFFDE